MALEIQRGKSTYVYKINPYNNRQILVRKNRHNARWQHHSRHDTASHAIAAILQLDKPDEVTEADE